MKASTCLLFWVLRVVGDLDLGEGDCLPGPVFSTAGGIGMGVQSGGLLVVRLGHWQPVVVNELVAQPVDGHNAHVHAVSCARGKAVNVKGQTREHASENSKGRTHFLFLVQKVFFLTDLQF